MKSSRRGVEATLRAVVVACQALTIAITWPLWQARAPSSSAPLLPFGPFARAPSVGVAWPLLASLALALFRPRLGAWLHLLLLAAAIALDETRLQPQSISLALLLFATLESAAARAVGLAHLVALWLWSGLHKLASPDYWTAGGQMYEQVVRGGFLEHRVALVLALAVAFFESALGVAALFARTRPLARRCGAAFHLVVLASLALGLSWNDSVWPWNVALAFAAWILLDERSEPTVRQTFARAPALARVVVAVELVAPLGYEFGLVAAPLAQALYCLSTPRAVISHADGTSTPLYHLAELHVFLPGSEDVLVARFRAVGHPGDILVVHDGRWCARARGSTEHAIHYPPP